MSAVTEDDDNDTIIEHIILVAHNGRRFDIPFLFRQFQQLNVNVPQSLMDRLYILDTYEMARGCYVRYNMNAPENYKLATLYTYCTGLELGDNAHRADGDVAATIRILIFSRFWFHRLDFCHKIDLDGKVTTYFITVHHHINPNDDSDTDSSTNSSSSNDSGAEDGNVNDDYIKVSVTETMGWQMNVGMGDVEHNIFLKSNYRRIPID
jgi:Exonuclease